MMVWLLFIIDLMGLFFYNKIGSIISIGDLPTTNIIEPVFLILKALSKFHAVDWIVELGMKKPPKWVAKSHKISLFDGINQVLSLFFK